MAEMTLDSGMMQYPSEDGTSINAYLSHPTKAGKYPGAVVIMEAFGLHDSIKTHARHIAAQGYVAVAPDLYTREGALDASDLASVMKRVTGLPDAQAVADLKGAVAYLKGRPDCTGKVGAIGWCSGGRHTVLLACNARIDAAVDCYGGRVVQDQVGPAQPVAPVDQIRNLSCPLLGLFGEEDTNPSPAHVERIRQELTKHRKVFEIKSYSKAGHGFFADYRPSYRPEAAKDAWQRVFDWYGRHLK